jgi:hypothetical protein
MHQNQETAIMPPHYVLRHRTINHALKGTGEKKSKKTAILALLTQNVARYPSTDPGFGFVMVGSGSPQANTNHTPHRTLACTEGLDQGRGSVWANLHRDVIQLPLCRSPMPSHHLATAAPAAQLLSAPAVTYWTRHGWPDSKEIF